MFLDSTPVLPAPLLSSLLMYNRHYIFEVYNLISFYHPHPPHPIHTHIREARTRVKIWTFYRSKKFPFASLKPFLAPSLLSLASPQTTIIAFSSVD